LLSWILGRITEPGWLSSTLAVAAGAAISGIGFVVGEKKQEKMSF